MGLLDAIDIGAGGLNVHGKRMDVHTQNIVNVDTPNYVRKIPVLMAREDNSFEGLLNNMKENVFAVGTIPIFQAVWLLKVLSVTPDSRN
jgi:flagellar basal body rod protein FlgB